MKSDLRRTVLTVDDLHILKANPGGGSKNLQHRFFASKPCRKPLGNLCGLAAFGVGIDPSEVAFAEDLNRFKNAGSFGEITPDSGG